MVAEFLEPAATVRISTAELPDGLRISAMREYLTELMRVEVTPHAPEAPMRYVAEIRTTAGASWGGAQSPSLTTSRTAELCKDGGDELILVVPHTPIVIQAPGEDELAIAPGGAVLLSQARRMRIVVGEAGRTWALRVPRAAIARRTPGLAAAPIMAVASDTPMLPLLVRYGRMLEVEPLAGEAAQAMAARHLQDLMSLVIGAPRDFQAHAEATSLGEVRLRGVRADIAAHLGRINLSLAWVAARQGVSPRHLQRLLAGEGLSFSGLLRRARVERARALLEDPHNAHRTILSIALDTGFAEASALNRAFRQEYGLRPSDVR